MKKKRQAVILAAIVILNMIFSAGCAGGGSTDRQQRDGEEPVEITVALWDAEENLVGDEILTEVEERFHIRLIPENVTWDDYSQKIKLWASAGSLPDLFIGDFRESPAYMEWVEKGILKEIPEELSAYPNLEAYLEAPGIREGAEVDGKLYCIPRLTYPSQEWTATDRIVAYRWDLAQQAGIYEEPETWEEFCTMISAIMEADPEGKRIRGLTATGKEQLAGILIPYASPVAATEGTTFHWILDEDGLYKPAYLALDMLPAFQLARDMYTQGVIEQDIMLTTSQSAEEKFLQGENAAILYSGGYAGEYMELSIYWEEIYGRKYTEDVKALHLMEDVNGNKTYPVWGYAWSESYINANADEEKLDRILTLYDYLLGDEGAFYTSYGPEGELYEMEDGKVKLHEDIAVVREKYPSTGFFSVLARWEPSSYDDRFVSGVPEEYVRVNRGLVEEARQVQLPEINIRCMQIMKERLISFAVQPQDDILTIMTGEEPVEQMWEQLRQEYEKAGLWKVITEVNGALEEEN